MPSPTSDARARIESRGAYHSPRWSFEFTDCSVPVTLDQYSNCGFGCLYCFSTYQRDVGRAAEAYQAGDARLTAVDVERVKRIFEDPSASQFGRFVQERRVLQWGGLSDPFCPFEQRYGVGLDLLRFLRERSYPITFSTKGVWWLDDPRYVEVVQGSGWNVKVSIVTSDPEKARWLERGVPEPDERFRALGRIAALGATSTLRLRPFMPGITDPWHAAMIRRAAGEGATAVSTEFYCLDVRSAAMKRRLATINTLSGIDYGALYREGSSTQGYLRLNREIKRPFVEEMAAAANESGIRLHISDPDFKELGATGSCCGLPEDANWSRGQFTEALRLCRERGEVRWADLRPHLTIFDGVRAVSMDGCQIARSTKRARVQHNFHSVTDLLRFYWNNPEQAHSPYRMFNGLMRPEGTDEDGNRVYWYDPSRE